MNLFPTDCRPIVAAMHLDDKRVVKIALEAAQITSTIMRERGRDDVYRASHEHSGVTVWLRDVPGAMGWTVRYGLALCDVYRLFGRKPEHGSAAMLRHISNLLTEEDWQWPARFQNSARRKHGPDFSHVADVRSAYRQYLCARWPGDARAPVWTGRPRPRWARWSLA